MELCHPYYRTDARKRQRHITQLPQTGATTMAVMLVGAFAIILVATASGFADTSVHFGHYGHSRLCDNSSRDMATT